VKRSSNDTPPSNPLLLEKPLRWAAESRPPGNGANNYRLRQPLTLQQLHQTPPESAGSEWARKKISQGITPQAFAVEELNSAILHFFHAHSPIGARMDPADRLAIRLAIRAIDASMAAQLALAKERRATDALHRFAQRQGRLRNEAQGSPSIHGPWASPLRGALNQAGRKSAYALAPYL
jgi:hypothetical protein